MLYTMSELLTGWSFCIQKMMRLIFAALSLTYTTYKILHTIRRSLSFDQGKIWSKTSHETLRKMRTMKSRPKISANTFDV